MGQGADIGAFAAFHPDGDPGHRYFHNVQAVNHHLPGRGRYRFSPASQFVEPLPVVVQRRVTGGHLFDFPHKPGRGPADLRRCGQVPGLGRDLPGHVLGVRFHPQRERGQVCLGLLQEKLGQLGSLPQGQGQKPGGKGVQRPQVPHLFQRQGPFHPPHHVKGGDARRLVDEEEAV